MTTKIDYTKLPKSFEDQFELLEKRGLTIPKEYKTKQILQNISYHRLSEYMYPFLKEPKDKENFKENANFETIFKIYQFDSELRMVLFYAIEQIEIALRAQIIFHMSKKYNSGFWFENKDAFTSYPFYISLLRRIDQSVKNSNQEHIKKYSRKYNQHLPPAWKSFETLSFNTLFSIFKNLRDNTEKKIIAHHFGVHHVVLKSWIDTMIYIRNLCAHHSRIWNIKLTIKPTWPKRPHYDWVQTWDNQIHNYNQNGKIKLYAAICVTKYLMDRVNPDHRLTFKLNVLLQKYPQVDIAHMGFPKNWQSEPLWTKKNENE